MVSYSQKKHSTNISFWLSNFISFEVSRETEYYLNIYYIIIILIKCYLNKTIVSKV